MHITTEAANVTTRVDRVVQSVPLTPHLWAVRWTDTTTVTTTSPKGAHTQESRDSREEILTKTQKEAIAGGGSLQNRPHRYLLSPHAVEILRTQGFMPLLHIMQEGTPDKDSQAWFDGASAHATLALHDIQETALLPFSRVVGGNGLGDHLIAVFDYSSDTVTTHDGKALAMLCQGEYISGHFDNAHYDLDKAAAHLFQRHDVVMLDESNRRSRGGNGLATTAQSCIQRIPSYNAERGKTESLLFRWAPTQEEWNRIQARTNGAKGFLSSEIWKAVFDLDILGLRACGAALFDDFYQERRTSHDDED